MLPHCVGAAVNQDGRSSSLTAPNGPAQQEAIHSALADAAMSTGDIAALQLHGTGTALGDPIEINAALSVLLANGRKQSQQQVAKSAASAMGWEVLAVGAAGTASAEDAAGPLELPPLQLLAAKSIVGHAEPAAGLTGVLYAVHQLRQASAAPILHLHSLNPHVTAAISSINGAGGKLGMPREVLPLVGTTTAASVGVGVSAFAFQGTNAHAIIAVVRPGDELVVGSGASHGLPWEKQRLWVHSRLSALVHSAAVVGSPRAGASIMFQCRLNAAALAGWWDHRVGGRALVPGAGFLELGARCAQSVAKPSAAGAQVPTAVALLTQVSIPSPCLLPDFSISKFEAAEVEPVTLLCSVSNQGDLRILSNAGKELMSGTQHVHLIAQVAVTSLAEPTHLSSGKAAAAVHVLQRLLGCPAAAAAQGQMQAGIAAAVADITAGRDRGQATSFPAQLDGALQLSAVARGWLQPKLMDTLQVPAAAEAYISAGSSMDNVDLIAAVAIKPGFDAKLMEVDVNLLGGVEVGGAVAKLKGLQARSAGAAMVLQKSMTATRDRVKEVSGEMKCSSTLTGIPYLPTSDAWSL